MTDRTYAQKIIAEYSEKQESKTDKLKRLDDKVKNTPRIVTLVIGIIASLIFGTGLCLAMNIIGGTIPFMIVGIILGVIGGFLMGINYFIYKSMLAKRKEKYGDEILALSKEILENAQN